MNPSLPSLLQRVESAKCGDRELDAIVWCALEHPMEKPQRNFFYTNREEWGFFKTNQPLPGLTFFDAPPLTSSIDAALALVERLKPGHGVSIGRSPDGMSQASIFYPDARRTPFSTKADRKDGHLALTLLAALLRTLAAQEGDG